MRYLSWNKILSIGIEDLDKEHEEIIVTTSLLSQTLEGSGFIASIIGIVDLQLDVYKKYFAKEELFLIVLDCPNIADHKKQHLQLQSKITQCREQISASSSVLGSEKPIDELNELVIDHIIDSDSDILLSLQRNNERHVKSYGVAALFYGALRFLENFRLKPRIAIPIILPMLIFIGVALVVVVDAFHTHLKSKSFQPG